MGSLGVKGVSFSWLQFFSEEVSSFVERKRIGRLRVLSRESFEIEVSGSRRANCLE